jgi:hypothetical protein
MTVVAMHIADVPQNRMCLRPGQDNRFRAHCNARVPKHAGGGRCGWQSYAEP